MSVMAMLRQRSTVSRTAANLRTTAHEIVGYRLNPMVKSGPSSDIRAYVSGCHTPCASEAVKRRPPRVASMQWNGFALCLLLLSGFSTFNDTAFASTPLVTVTSPGNGSQDGSPVNFIASATSPDCASGIAAIRIYTAPGVGAYTVDASSLNVNLSLAAGTYNMAVQAWDNCGGVGKTPVNIAVGGSGLPEPKFLYASSYSKNRIYEYNVDPNSGVISPTTQGFVATGSEPEQIGTDKGGFRLYVVQVGAEHLKGDVLQ